MDPTHGRYLLPTAQVEKALDASSQITTLQRRVFFNPNEVASSSSRIVKGEDVTLTEAELQDVGGNDEWIYYKVWELKDEFLEDRGGRGVDVVYVHVTRNTIHPESATKHTIHLRLTENSGRYAFQCEEILKAGFRVVLPDMPGVHVDLKQARHGRSTGVHGYLPTARSLPDAVFTVLQDLRTLSSSTASPPRKTFLTGTSMGGLTVLYALTTADRFTAEEREKMPPVHGAFAMCPLLDVPDRPNAIVTAVGKLLVKVAGKVPLLDGGPLDLISDDARVPAEFRQDPMNYTGKLRIATGIALLNAFTETVDNAGFTKTPIRLLHGDSDRTTSHKASMEYMEKVKSADKSIKIYEGYQHVMVKVVDGKSEEADFARNSAVLNDWKTWLLERS
ncbi:hypothetical protein QFC21_000055 [Naganishia friedmannii]|uniref:Uncharacterized protein n=1 Tax=Naganishia friedmannii TaxID=89922 RepID=A0ACC2WC77_9TREE|nr:hypothetical protein QFC21_000055 [Naganishia friedmannii]